MGDTGNSAESSFLEMAYGALLGNIVYITLVLMLIVSWFIGFYIRGKIRKREAKSRKIFWFSPSQLTPFSSYWSLLLTGSILWTTLAMIISSLVLVLFQALSPSDYQFNDVYRAAFDFPGVFFVFTSCLLGMLSVINTFCLLQKDIKEIVSFADLADNLQRTEGYRAHDVRGAEKGSASYFIDYVPIVGWLSDHKAYLRILDELKKWSARRDSISHYLFLAPTELTAAKSRKLSPFDNSQELGAQEKVLEAMVRRNELGSEKEVQTKFEEMCYKSKSICADLDSGLGAVWYTGKVNFEHYYVDLEHAIAYYVVPAESSLENRNVVKGTVHRDARYVDYMRQVCETYLQQAVTPDIFKIDSIPDNLNSEGLGGESMAMSFKVGQLNIHALEIQFHGEGKKILNGVGSITQIPLTMTGQESWLYPETVFGFTPPSNARWARVRMIKRVKETDETIDELPIKSPYSFFIKLPT